MRLPNIRSLLQPPSRRRVDARQQATLIHPPGGSSRPSPSNKSEQTSRPDDSGGRATLHTHSRSRPSPQPSFSSHSSPPESPSDDATNVTPPLLLEGEELCLSSDGYARTFYQMCTSEHVPIAIEEVYHLKTARKRFLLRQASSGPIISSSCSTKPPVVVQATSDCVVPLGALLAQVNLQEVDLYHHDAVTDQPVATGGTTWEASLIMALYFAGHPNELVGNVLELGSGLGLGGILVNLVPRWSDHFSTGVVETITLTDCNDVVLRQCQRNVVDSLGYLPMDLPMYVRKLDWNDVARWDGTSNGERYDTVLACDCVFRHDDVPVLARTLKSLLDDAPCSKIHLFSPYNRTPLSDMVNQLKNLGLVVQMEQLEMNRYRLKPEESRHEWWHPTTGAVPPQRDPMLQECYYASKAVATFAHITATHNLSTASCYSMTDVD